MTGRPQLLIGARVALDAGLVDGVALRIEGDRIVAVETDSAALRADAQVVALAGQVLSAGFIDVQVNGGGDVLFNDAPTVDGITRMAAAHRRFGTTGLLPTLITATPQRMRAAVDAVDAAIAQRVPGVLGIHLEGPYLAQARRGVHDAGLFTVPDAQALALASALRGGVTVLTLAPEQVSEPLLRALVQAGVIVCAGHTAATYAQTRAALDAGVRGFTHLFNAMTPLQSREPGVVGAALEDAHSWCGLIVDGEHVHAASLRVALAAKPRGKLLLVTDAMPPVGGTRATFQLDGITMTCRDGRCSEPNGGLAGSSLDMASAVRNTIALGVPPEEALRMASLYPAQFLRMGDVRGRIAPGLQADLVALDARWQATCTWIGGSSARTPAG